MRLGRFGRQERTRPREVDVARVARDRSIPGIQIVDVRELDEWRDGHIPGAIHIPLGELAGRRSELDPDRPIVTVCRSGKRSLNAAQQLTQAGFPAVASMAGGMLAWRHDNQPVER